MARTTSYVKPSTIRSLSWLVGIAGLCAAVAGPVYALNGVTQAGAAVEVRVELADQDGAEVGRLPVGQPAVVDLPDGVTLSAVGADVELIAGESTVVEQLLSRGDVAVLGLAIGLGAWLLRPLLESVAGGRPFGSGNARRLAGLATVAVVAAGIGPLLPQIGSLVVLDRLDLVGPGSPFVLGLAFYFTPALLVGLLLLVLAEAFRQGERLDEDVEGLV